MCQIIKYQFSVRSVAEGFIVVKEEKKSAIVQSRSQQKYEKRLLNLFNSLLYISMQAYHYILLFFNFINCLPI